MREQPGPRLFEFNKVTGEITKIGGEPVKPVTELSQPQPELNLRPQETVYAGQSYEARKELFEVEKGGRKDIDG